MSHEDTGPGRRPCGRRHFLQTLAEWRKQGRTLSRRKGGKYGADPVRIVAAGLFGRAREWSGKLLQRVEKAVE